MADRSQNILINYKFNTAEIEKANAILHRANNTTNQLQNEAQKSGQKISSSFTTAGQSIQFMTTRLERLKTQISISSDPKQVARLSAEYKTLKTQIDAATKSAFGLPKALKETKAETQSLTQQFTGLYNAARLFITAGIIKEVAGLAINMAELSGKVEGVERAFQRAFPNSEALLSELTEATHGTISEFELMSNTLKANNLGIPVQQLATFFEFATIRAQQTGEEVNVLVDNIVNGLGRKSTRVIDNLGISATRIKDEFKGVSLEQLSVAEVAEGVSNIIRQETDKMGGYIQTQQTEVKRLGVAWQELKEGLSNLNLGDIIKFITGADVGEFTLTGHLLGLVEALRDAAEIIRDQVSAEEFYEQKQTKQIALISEREFAQRVLNGTMQENVKAIEDEIAAITSGLGVFAKERGFAQERIDNLNRERQAIIDKRFISHQEQAEFETRLALEIKLRDHNKENIAIDQEILKLLQARLAALKEVNEEEIEATGIIQRKKKEIEDLQKQLEATNNISDLGVGGRLTKALEIAQAELGDLQRAFSDIDPIKFVFKIDEATGSLNKLIKAVERINAGQMLGRFEEGLAQLAEMKPVQPFDLGTTTEGSIFWEDMRREWEDGWRDITASGVDIQADVINDLLQTELDNYKRRLRALGDFYDQQQLLAGDNEKAKSLLRIREERETTALNRKIFEKEKQTRRSQAIIDGAAGVAKAFATYPYPAAIIISALIAAQTIAQVRTINRQRSGYAKGVFNLKGPGTETSDSIPVNLSRGESVMTAWQTKNAGDVIKDIQAKKLDNKVLRDLKQGRAPVQQQQFNDERIIKAIEKNRPPDVLEQSGIAYEVKSKGDNYRIKVRSKSGRFRI